MASPAPTLIPDSQPSQDRSARPRARNWTEAEMLCLAQAKKVELELDVDNIGQRRFLSSVQKWNEISLLMSAKGYMDRIGTVCNTKWNNLFGDWKAIRDFILSSGGTSYYNMSKNERIQAKLVTKFNKDLYDVMDSFCLQRPCMAPPSTFDSGVRIASHNASVPVSHNPTPPRPGSPSQQTVTEENETIVLSPDNDGQTQNVQAPGDNVRGSTGRAKRKRTIDISGVLKTSHESLILSLQDQTTKRMLCFDKQFELEKAKMDLEKSEKESLSTDRKAMVSVFKDIANAMNILAHRHLTTPDEQRRNATSAAHAD